MENKKRMEFLLVDVAGWARAGAALVNRVRPGFFALVIALALQASPAAADGPLMFQRCSNAQIGAITADLKTAQEEVRYGVIYLMTRAKNDQGAYASWFGYWSDARAAAVTKNMIAIQAALTGGIGFDCGPPDSVCGTNVANIIQGTEHRLNLCPPYFTSAVDSILGGRPGVMVHEISHFSNVANTANAGTIVKGDPNLFVSPEDEALFAWMFPDKAVQFSEAYQYFAATVVDKAPLPPQQPPAGPGAHGSGWPSIHCSMRVGARCAPASGPLVVLFMVTSMLVARRKRMDPPMNPASSPRRNARRRIRIAPIWFAGLCVILLGAWMMRSRVEQRRRPPAVGDDSADEDRLPRTERTPTAARPATARPVRAPASTVEQPEPATVPEVPLDTEYGEAYLDVVKRMNLDADRERRLRSKIFDVAYACRLAQSLDFGRSHEPSSPEILPSGEVLFHLERRPKDLGKHWEETLRVTSEELDAFVKDLLTPKELKIWSKTFRYSDAVMAEGIVYQPKPVPLPPTPDLPNPFTPEEQQNIARARQAEFERTKDLDTSWFTKGLEEDRRKQEE